MQADFSAFVVNMRFASGKMRSITLAEVYSVMTRLPVRPRINPEQELLFIESIRERFTVVKLNARECYEVIATAARRGIGGARFTTN